MIGDRHPAALGASSLETFCELRGVLEPLMARVRTGETVRQEAQLYRYVRNGVTEDTWFTLSHQPVRQDGQVIGVLTIGVEVTEQVRAEQRWGAAQAELERRAARQGFLLRLSDAVHGVSDPATIMAIGGESLGGELGLSRSGYGQALDDRGDVIRVEGEWTDAATPALTGPFRLEAFGPGMAAQLLSGETVRIDDVLQDPRTCASADAFAKVGVRAMVVAPLVIEGGLVAVLYAHQSRPRRWTDEEAALIETVAERMWGAVQHARAETALRASQTRYGALLEALDEGFCVIELVAPSGGQGVDYRYIEANPALAQRSGIEGVVGRTIREILPEDEANFGIDIFDGVRTSGEPLRFRRRLGVTNWLLELFAFPFGGAGAPQIAILFQDITGRTAAEERLHLVVNELNHRVKNNLAIVQAMAAQTFRGLADPKAAVDDFLDRLMALARANDVLTGERAASVEMSALAHQALAAHVGKGARLSLGGPPIELPGPVALSLSLALHELATNAVKYGAWSNRDGVVSLTWSLMREDSATPRLGVTWRESGGPPVTAPARRGFGSRLIERSLSAQLGGRARLMFERGGLVCEVDAPLATEGRGR